MAGLVTIRATAAGDVSAVDALLARSYPVLLKPDYPPSVMVTAVPLIARARRSLVTSGSYYVAEDDEGRALGAGGWTHARRRAGWADIRHVVVDPAHVRRGIGTALFRRIFHIAAQAGVASFDCLATRTAVPFYRAVGFSVVGAAEVPLAPGIVFPVVRMVRSR